MKIRFTQYDLDVMEAPFTSHKVGEAVLSDEIAATYGTDWFALHLRNFARANGFWMQFYSTSDDPNYRFDVQVWRTESDYYAHLRKLEKYESSRDF